MGLRVVKGRHRVYENSFCMNLKLKLRCPIYYIWVYDKKCSEYRGRKIKYCCEPQMNKFASIIFDLLAVL